MFEIAGSKTYSIVKQSSRYQGRCTITRERTVNSNATWQDVFEILAKPERYEGERAEAMMELEEGGTCSYAGLIILEH